MSRFNTTVRSKTENLAGGVAFKHSPEMELVVSVLTTFLESKFYESGDERIDRIKLLIKNVPDEFTAKLAVMARKEFHLRSVSHLLVSELARKHRGDSLVSKVLNLISERPDDLTEVVALLGKPLPKQIKLGIQKALARFKPYQLAKYRGEGKKVKLVDLFNLVHPKAPKGLSKAWKGLMEGELKNEDTWEARLSSGEDKADVWKDLISEGKIGYMALLRNLRNISEQADDKTILKACKLISDEEGVRKSKQLPFRFYNAYEQVKNRKMLDAISEALEISLDNVPKFKGRTLVAVDASGSMSGDPIKKASVFAAALIKSNGADVILYDEGVKELSVLSKTPVLTIAEKIQNAAMGGGTNTSLVFSYAANKKADYDRIIILSDNESWQDSGWNNGGTIDTYRGYVELGFNPTVYAIDVAGHGTKDVKGAKVYHIAGWSEMIFEFMKWIEKENQLVDFVKNYSLDE